MQYKVDFIIKNIFVDDIGLWTEAKFCTSYYTFNFHYPKARCVLNIRFPRIFFFNVRNTMYFIFFWKVWQRVDKIFYFQLLTWRYCGRSGHKNNKYQIKSNMKMGNGMDRQIKRRSHNHMHTNTNMQLKFKVQTTYKFKVYD